MLDKLKEALEKVGIKPVRPRPGKDEKEKPRKEFST